MIMMGSQKQLVPTSFILKITIITVSNYKFKNLGDDKHRVRKRKCYPS